jgi:phospholipid transport system substrate-binding protein
VKGRRVGERRGHEARHAGVRACVHRRHAHRHRRGRRADGSAPGGDRSRPEGAPGREPQGTSQRDARRQQIRAIADEIFDWQETGKRALARHWQGRSPSERREFSTLFADLIERSYVSKIEQYSGERVVYAGETVEGDQATVRTKLITKSNTEIPIDYRMQKEGDRWRAYDVVIEGVSLVSNYRTQFNRIIQQSGYPELVNKMKAKQEELQFETGQTKS